MLTIALFLINLIITASGIYIFDYQVDNSINNPLVIILSITVAWILMFLILGVYIELAYYLVANKKPKNSMLMHKLAKQMVSFPMHLTNMKVSVEGKENLPKDPGFSIYVNHTSMMDISVLMYKLYDYPVAFLEKENVGELFSLGKWTHKLGCVMINRDNDRKAAESIINVIKNIKSGSTMVVFPEGTRSKEIGKLLDFKQGSFKVALKSKAPLLPITIVKAKNYNNIKWPFRKNIKLVIHEPIPFEVLKTMKTLELSEKVREIIAGPLNQ